ncbi:MAG: hypothetical protein OEX12_12685 [Gammaproteobacteria bacterium]|nr:hypothetical protein [Gammaproteobacteria bacterium]
MKLSKIDANNMKAYYVMDCETPEKAKAVQEFMEGPRRGWEFLNDGMEDHELALFVDSGKYGQEKELREDWALAKASL